MRFQTTRLRYSDTTNRCRSPYEIQTWTLFSIPLKRPISCRSPYEIPKRFYWLLQLRNYWLPFSLWDSQYGVKSSRVLALLPFSLWDSTSNQGLEWRSSKRVAVLLMRFPDEGGWLWKRIYCVAVLLMRFREALVAKAFCNLMLPFSLWDSYPVTHAIYPFQSNVAVLLMRFQARHTSAMRSAWTVAVLLMRFSKRKSLSSGHS